MGIRVIGLVILLPLVTASSLHADYSVRECIGPAAPANSGYWLPPWSSWKTIAELEFNTNTPSDLVIHAVVDIQEGNTPNAYVSYQITLDGAPLGWYTRRIPERLPDSQLLRSFKPDVTAGVHTLGVRVHNHSPYNVYYGRAWISPLLVEASEATVSTLPGGTVTVGSGWTTLMQLSIANPNNKMMYLGAFTTVETGNALNALEYRFVRGATQVEIYYESVPDVLPEGLHFGFIDENPGTSTVTYMFQARSPSGSTATFTARELYAQTVPRVTVFDATVQNKSIVSDHNFYTVVETPWKTLLPQSIGPYGTNSYGHAYFSFTGPYAEESDIQLELETPYFTPPTPTLWEIGWLGYHPVGYTMSNADITDWEQLGLSASGNHKVRLKARGICSSGNVMSFLRARLQVMVLPDNERFTFHSCAISPTTCCANNYPSCIVYDCRAGDMAIVGGLPSRNCF